MGAVETENRLQATCTVAASGLLTNSNGVAEVIHTPGTGLYEVVLEEPIARAQAVIICTSNGPPSFASYEQSGAAEEAPSINVNTTDADNPPGAPSEQSFNLSVWQLPRLETP